MKRVYALAIVQCAALGALTAPAVVGLSVLISRMVGEDGAPAALSVVVVAGSTAALVANPLMGWCADRTPRRYGGRRTWIVGGALGGLAGSAAVAFAPDTAALVLAWAFTQIAYNACFAGVNSMVSRGLAPEHRLRLGAVFSAVTLIGTLPGLIISAVFAHDIVTMMLAVPAGAAVLIPVIVLTLPDPDERAGAADGTNWRRIGELRAILTRRFLAVMAVRFVFAVELAAGLVFGLYLFTDRWGLAENDAVRLVAGSTFVGAAGLLCASTAVALLRHRAPGETRLLGIATIVLTLAMLARALAPTPEIFVIATFFAGGAIGLSFVSTRAIVQGLLPPTRAALGLGVFNVANTLAPIVAPLIATALLGLGRETVADPYAGMYVLLAVPVLACLAVLPALRRPEPGEMPGSEQPEFAGTRDGL
jgi:MFS family permease